MTFQEFSDTSLFMPGTIRAKGKCPVCNYPFTEQDSNGLFCSTCKTRPVSYYLDIPARYSSTKNRERIFTEYIDCEWIPLSWYRADRLIKTISKAFEDNPIHRVDVSIYVKQQRQKFLFSNFCEKWVASKADYKPSWQETVKIYARKFFIPFFENKDLRDIDNYEIELFSQTLKGYSIQYRANIMNALQNLLNDAHNWLKIEKIQIPAKKKKTPKKVIKTISGGTQTLIYNKIPQKHKSIFCMMFYHGLRPGEARAILKPNIDIEEGTITVRTNFSLKILTTTKTESERKIPLTDEMIAYIKQIYKMDSDKEGFLFKNNGNNPYCKDTIIRIYKKAAKGITDVSLYSSSRHAFATRLVKEGNDVYTIMKLMGHTKLETTLRYFGEVSIQEMRLAIAGKKKAVTDLSVTDYVN